MSRILVDVKQKSKTKRQDSKTSLIKVNEKLIDADTGSDGITNTEKDSDDDDYEYSESSDASEEEESLGDGKNKKNKKG